MEYLDIKVTKDILPSISSTFILNNFDESLSYTEVKSDYDMIRARVNSLIFRKKNELIYFCLILYKYFLDEKEGVAGNKELFSFSFYKKISRIVVHSENKITSFYMPFIPNYQFETRVLESRLNPGVLISLDELIFLIEYFKYSMFLSFERQSFLDQTLKIESIKDSFSEQTMGFKLLDEEKLSKLVSELLFYDSSYLRYDIDLEHSLDAEGQFDRDRVFEHPPYHIDSDYRDAPSYKIGFDKKISDDEFLKIFQMEKSTASMIIKDDYRPERLLGDVRQYRDSLN
ncbi:hypothetical protein ACXM1Q_007000 [Streptococcus sp. 10F2]